MNGVTLAVVLVGFVAVGGIGFLLYQNAKTQAALDAQKKSSSTTGLASLLGGVAGTVESLGIFA
jgi:uncharacterized membrane protein YsdA (DUF1294 family)